MTSGTTGTMSGTGKGPYLADLIAQWLGSGGAGADQAQAQPRALFPAGLGYGGLQTPVSPAAMGVPGVGPNGPNASMFDDYGANSSVPMSGAQYTAGFNPRDPNRSLRPGMAAQNVSRVGASPSGVPGVYAGVPGARSSPMATANGRYGGAGSAQELLAAILGTGGVY